jgi:hypothetical protein
VARQGKIGNGSDEASIVQLLPSRPIFFASQSKASLHLTVANICLQEVGAEGCGTSINSTDFAASSSLVLTRFFYAFSCSLFTLQAAYIIATYLLMGEFSALSQSLFTG